MIQSTKQLRMNQLYSPCLSSSVDKDERKKALRRRKNRIAAQKCRQRKMEQLQMLQMKKRILLNEQEALKYEIKMLEIQKQESQLALNEHMKSKPCNLTTKL